MDYATDWKGKNWTVTSVDPSITDLVAGPTPDTLTFDGVGTGIHLQDVVKKAPTNKSWGEFCKYHSASTTTPPVPDHVTLKKGMSDFVIVRDTRSVPVKLLCFTGTNPPDFDLSAPGTPTVACWTAQDG